MYGIPHALPTKQIRIISTLVGKVYKAKGQVVTCLHTMALLQTYQADLLRDLDKDEGGGHYGKASLAELVKEKNKFSLLATPLSLSLKEV